MEAVERPMRNNGTIVHAVKVYNYPPRIGVQYAYQRERHCIHILRIEIFHISMLDKYA